MADQLVQLAAQLSLAHGQHRAVLVVDALNYTTFFVPIDEKSFRSAFAPALFREAERRIAALAQATTGVKLIWVFDNGQQSEEAKQKWLERRTAEVVTGERNLPCSSEIVFKALLEEHGFLTLYPPEIDGDDAVALLAWKLGGSVLSRDRDLLRYEPQLPRSRVYKSIAFQNGAVVLELQKAPLPENVEPRNLRALQHLLPTDLTDAGLQAAWGMNVPSMIVRGLLGESKRGNADGLTGSCGNLNRTALGLIAAVYYAAGVHETEGVNVSLPAAARDANGHVVGCEMRTEQVLPDCCTAKRLVAMSPRLVKQWLTSEAIWPADFDFDGPGLPPMSASDKESRMKRTAERAHAVCIMAAEIVDAMLYAKDPERTTNSTKIWERPPTSAPERLAPYSPAKRVWTIYKSLVRSHELLVPDQTFNNDWWLGLTDRELARKVEIYAPDATIPPVHVPPYNADAWCRVGVCQGLRHRGCQATGGAGPIFFDSVNRAARNGKDPLCQSCITAISRPARDRGVRLY